MVRVEKYYNLMIPFICSLITYFLMYLLLFHDDTLLEFQSNLVFQDLWNKFVFYLYSLLFFINFIMSPSHCLFTLNISNFFGLYSYNSSSPLLLSFSGVFILDLFPFLICIFFLVDIVRKLHIGLHLWCVII